MRVVSILTVIAAAKTRLFPFLSAQPEGDPDYRNVFGAYLPVQLTVGNETILMETQMAVSSPQMHQGLMYRTQLGENQGMFFMYTSDAQRVLYMRNTKVPLDAGWFSVDGTLQEVAHLKPYDETWVWTTGSNIRFGLEMNEGWFSKHGAEPGKPNYVCKEPGCVKIDVGSLVKAMKVAGYDDACASYITCPAAAPAAPDAPVPN
mmetsp:Transcript_50931/g.111577  ORF Transcript_50931/g.111577 Transcript_50931/m.111577 type:complete len:204 (+) Transcript_50931:74-685(+)